MQQPQQVLSGVDLSGKRIFVTGVSAGLGVDHIQKMIDQMNEQLTAERKRPLQWPESIPQGAATSVWAGVVASADEIGGQYCANCRVAHVVADHATINAIGEGVRGYALDPNNAKALWKKDEELVGESF